MIKTLSCISACLFSHAADVVATATAVVRRRGDRCFVSGRLQGDGGRVV